MVFFAIGAAIFGLLVALFYATSVLRAEMGNPKMVAISHAIQEGAQAFLSREYRTLLLFLLVMAILIIVLLNSPLTAVAYLAGAILSGTAGFIGLRIATQANTRTTQAAQKGIAQALSVAFRGGSVMGLSVVGLGLLGLSVSYLIFQVILELPNAKDIIAGFGLGASSIALFARVGGGIFTKGADVGADLVGKVEAGIPEDDPRNPAVIADNVGDNVGDVAGMGADLFESYIGSIVAPMALGAVLLGVDGMLLPLSIGAVGIIASVLGSFMVKTREGGNLERSLSMGTFSSAFFTLVGSFILVGTFLGFEMIGFFFSILAGLVAGILVGQVSEYYTSARYKPVKAIAESAGRGGAATNILAGFAGGMNSTLLSIVFVSGAVVVAYVAGEIAMTGGGIYGISLSAVGMLSITGMVVSVDAYGPIADNAGGIAEMAHLPPNVRKITDNLDAVGNTTAAIAKGFAIASAAVTALALFRAFAQAAGLTVIDLINYKTMVGLFLGGMFPFFFSSLAIKAVGTSADKMVEEVRRQFKEIPGLKEGKEGAKPEYAKCVDISTKAALWGMITPSLIAVFSPIVIGLWSPEALGGYLAGALVTGFLIAITMANAGGAWDNAKKYIEAGNLGGKGTPTHAAAVVGDTVGDPFKDTAGPSMNILIKVMSIVALIFAPLFAGRL